VRQYRAKDNHPHHPEAPTTESPLPPVAHHIQHPHIADPQKPREKKEKQTREERKGKGKERKGKERKHSHPQKESPV